MFLSPGSRAGRKRAGVTLSGYETLLNKRIPPRVITTSAISGTVTPPGDTADVWVMYINAPATVASPSGTPYDGQRLTLRFNDLGAGPVSITWNAVYRAFSTALPSATTSAKWLIVDFAWNAYDSKWDALNVQVQA